MCQIGDIILIDRFKDANGTNVLRHPFIVIDDQAGVIKGLDYDLMSVMLTSYKGHDDSFRKRYDPGYLFVPVGEGVKKDSHAKLYEIYYFRSAEIKEDEI